MGDLIARKNYSVAIKALAKAGNENAHYFICGKGPLESELKELAKSLGVENQVHFLGFRTDIKELLVAADVFLFTTLQEGLPRSMMEAMASGLPCIVSKIRGNVDLMEDGTGGYLCGSTDVDAFAKSIAELTKNSELRKKMSEYNLEHIKEFDVSVVEEEIRNIYNEVLGEK
ncbi:MAG: glycosyltransferase family 4 protein [Clostridia bacterium]|nr:glycosyltransferase family 4 protein [Clostridia bacterium]